MFFSIGSVVHRRWKSSGQSIFYFQLMLRVFSKKAVRSLQNNYVFFFFKWAKTQYTNQVVLKAPWRTNNPRNGHSGWKYSMYSKIYFSVLKRIFQRLNGVNKWKQLIKQTFFAAAILHPLWAKVFKSETTSFHYFSPRIPKI